MSAQGHPRHCVNRHEGEKSYLVLIDPDAGFPKKNDVKSTSVKDGTKEWTGTVVSVHAKQTKLVMKLVAKADDKDTSPETGTLTVTITNMGGATTTVEPVQVNYVNDPM
jgi:hypothetical protein